VTFVKILLPHFPGRTEGSHENLVRIVHVPTGIQTGHLLNTSQNRYCSRQSAQLNNVSASEDTESGINWKDDFECHISMQLARNSPHMFKPTLFRKSLQYVWVYDMIFITQSRFEPCNFRIQVYRFSAPPPKCWRCQSFQSHYGPGVDSASNINEYQESSWG
jgi:hypothetical protein